MTSYDFAKKMGVSYHVVMRWLSQGLVPGATKSKTNPLWPGEKNKSWDIPEAALSMARPSTKSEKEKRIIAELKVELAEANQRHMKLMMEHAKLRGSHDLLLMQYKHATEYSGLLEESLEKEQRAVNSQQLVIDVLKQTIRNREDEIDAGRRIYDDLKSKYDQLALTTEQLTPRKEELCQETKTISSSIPSMDSTPQSQSASGVGRLRTK